MPKFARDQTLRSAGKAPRQRLQKPAPSRPSSAVLVVLLLLLAISSGLAWAQSRAKKLAKIDRIALASMLLRDGHLERARRVLSKVELASKEMKKKSRRARFHMLMGIIQLKKGESGPAVRSFSKAIALGIEKPLLYLMLAQGHFRLARYQKALDALKKAPKSAEAMPGTFLLKAQSLWRLRRRSQAYQVLSKGHARHPKVHAMLRLQALLLIELKLSKAAGQKIYRYLQAMGAVKKKERIDTYLMFAGACRRQGLHKLSILLLEELRLLTQGKAQVPILVQLARVYLEQKKLRVAASLLERAAMGRNRLMVEAAELYRRAGMFWRALYLNAQVLQQKPKMRQRLGLLIELRRFEEAAALAPRLSRLGLLRDPKIVYALAFACYKTGLYKQAQRWLKRLTSREYFRKAMLLRKAMQSCAKRQWWCP